MTSIEKVRAIIQDTPLYAKEVLTLVTDQTSVQLYFFPAVASTVIITPSTTPAPSIDEDNGVLTFPTAPGAGDITVEYKHVNLLDAQIQAFIDMIDGDGDTDELRLAAADCLDAIASSQALIQKKMTVLDLQTDGPALAKALREHAKTLRDLVFSSDYAEADFDIAEQINDLPGFQEKVIKDWIKQS